LTRTAFFVRLLRDQATPCACCGELFNAGDRMILPWGWAKALIAIGDAEMLDANYRPTLR